MPQLVKGGKYMFAWSRVGDDGTVIVPPEALAEYKLEEDERLILRPSSRSSRGFVLGSPRSLERTVLGIVLEDCPELGRFLTSEGEVTEYKGKPYTWAWLRGGAINVPPATLERFGIREGDLLAVIRGSGLAVSFIVQGPIVEEAKRHPELEVFEPASPSRDFPPQPPS